MKTDIYMLS